MNIWFILGQIGIFLAAVMGMAIVDLQARQPMRPPWYYFIAVWTVSVGCAFLFASPYLHPVHDFVPISAYAFRFLFGVERTVIFVYYRYRLGKAMASQTALRLNLVLGLISAGVMVAGIGWGTVYSQLQANGAAIVRVGKEAKNAVIVADSIRVRQAQATSDSLRKQLLSIQIAAVVREKQIAGLQRTIDGLQAIINKLVDQIEDLTKLVRGVGANVERSRRSVPPVEPIQRPTPTINQKVEQPGPVPTRRGRKTADASAPFDENGHAVARQ